MEHAGNVGLRSDGWEDTDPWTSGEDVEVINIEEQSEIKRLDVW